MPRAVSRRLGSLGTVETAGLLTVRDTKGVEGTANHVVTNARKVADTAAADQDDRVFLKVVTFTRNVDRHFLLIREPHSSDLPQSRVRLLWGHRTDLKADAPLLRAAFQHW